MIGPWLQELPRFAAAPGFLSWPPALIVVSAFSPEEEASLLRLGARGVVTMDMEAAQFVAALGLVIDQRVVAISAALQLLTHGSNGRAPLTTRLREILLLLSRGKSSGQIAVALGVSASTVKTHVNRLVAQYGLSGHHDLVREAPVILRDVRWHLSYTDDRGVVRETLAGAGAGP